tara:strand:+ start:40950 stop:42005 length:1056 start_codon:yes stop_codon:yes gene_type:complete
MKKKISKNFLSKIYKKYSYELINLTEQIRNDYPKFKKFRATFSDFDGEIMYCLIREIKPKIFFEISPDCGYSSIYITSALKKNKKGILYSFEIEEKKFGKETVNFIKNNIRNYSYNKHQIIIGDATKTTLEFPDPDMVLIDSCHEDWFAKWYISSLLPRIKKIVIIQDIVFYDRIEYSGESRVLLKYLKNKKYISLGVLERCESFKTINNLFPRRRSFESNTILFSNKNDLESIKSNINDPLENNFFSLNINKKKLYQIENKLQENPQRQNIHRTFLRLSQVTNNDMYLKKAMGYSIDQVHFNNKPFNETLVHLFRNLHFIYFFKMIVFKPKGLINFLISIYFLLKNKFFK